MSTYLMIKLAVELDVQTSSIIALIGNVKPTTILTNAQVAKICAFKDMGLI